MKRAILALVVLAAAAVIGYKLYSEKPPAPSAPVASSTAAPGRSAFYLFHDPSDQDEGCRRIYAYADRAERELTGRVEVKRPDVRSEKSVVERYQVRVLPTILIVAPDGKVEGRFEGEDEGTVARLDEAFNRLRESK